MTSPGPAASNERRRRRRTPMPIERVQQWIGASLAFVILELLAGGMVMFAAWSARPGSQVPLVVISGVWGLGAIGGARLILQKRLLSPWLLVALVWPVVGAYLIS
jgi:hypothetical protein